MKIAIENISICPDELKRLLKSINLLPNDLEKFENDLMELSLQWNAEFYELREPFEKNVLRLNKKNCLKIRSLFSTQIPTQISELLEIDDFQNALFQLRRLINEKITLKTVIQGFIKGKEFNNPNQTFVFDKSIAAFSFNQDTSLELSSFRVIEILTRNKLPIERLRICPICKNIFWAKRTESPACSPAHVNTYNARQTRTRKKVEEFYKQREKLKTLDSKFGREHPLFLKQLELVNKIYGKIQEKVKKYGTV